MAVAQQDTKQTHGAQVSSLASLDRSLSTALFRSVGVQIPRPALMLFEHAGNGLFWIPGEPECLQSAHLFSRCHGTVVWFVLTPQQHSTAAAEPLTLLPAAPQALWQCGCCRG